MVNKNSRNKNLTQFDMQGIFNFESKWDLK